MSPSPLAGPRSTGWQAHLPAEEPGLGYMCWEVWEAGAEARSMATWQALALLWALGCGQREAVLPPGGLGQREAELGQRKHPDSCGPQGNMSWQGDGG